MSELKWLEDVLILLDSDSFTQAAQRRFVTQPAFSRRIAQLEAWLGTPIVDRKRKPVGILPGFREHEPALRDLVHRFYQLRTTLQDAAASRQRIVFVVQHSLAISRFPPLIQHIKQVLPDTCYRIQPENNEACPALFLKEAQFMLCYEQEGAAPLVTGQHEIIHLPLGHDRLIPVAAGELASHLLASTSGPDNTVLPLLLFPQSSFFSTVLANGCLPKVLRDYKVEVICESAFSVSLKEMALAGLGVAWLPEGLVQQELRAGRMSSLEHRLGECRMPVSLYYRRGSGGDTVFEVICQSCT